MNINAFSYKKVGQIQFKLKEEHVLVTNNCNLKTKPQYCKGRTSLQLNFILKSISSLLIRRFMVILTYFNPHDWFDLILKGSNGYESTESAITRQSMELHSFYTEIAETCQEKYIVQTSNYLGEGTLTWGQNLHYQLGVKDNRLAAFDALRPLIYLQPNHLHPIKNHFQDENHENIRFDLLIYFIFSAKLRGIDLLMHLEALYAPQELSDRFEIAWNSTLHLTENTPGYFLSLSAYYEHCYIQSIGKLINGMLKLYWIPYSRENLIANKFENNFYLYQDGKESILSWKEAASNCDSDNSTLPILTNKEIQTELVSLIDYAQMPIIFIGLYESKVSNWKPNINIYLW